MSKPALAALALLFSATGFAATVTVVVTENSFTANDGLVNVGDTITVDVFGSGFPGDGTCTGVAPSCFDGVVGTSVAILFNSAAVAVKTPTLTNGITLPTGSPFTGGVVAGTPYTSGASLNILAPTVGALPGSNFGGVAAFRVSFVATGLGLANISILDDQADRSWTDAVTFGAIPVDYIYQGNNIQVIPVPAAVWLFGSALGLLGVARRRLA